MTRLVIGQVCFRKEISSVGTFTVSHGFTFGTAMGTVGASMYRVEVPYGNAFVKPDTILQKSFTAIVTSAPCCFEVIPTSIVEDA